MSGTYVPPSRFFILSTSDFITLISSTSLEELRFWIACRHTLVSMVWFDADDVFKAVSSASNGVRDVLFWLKTLFYIT